LNRLSNKYFNVKFKLFDIDLNEAKFRVLARENYKDSNGVFFEESKVEYIEKQWLQYKGIKQYLLTNYEDKILF